MNDIMAQVDLSYQALGSVLLLPILGPLYSASIALFPKRNREGQLSSVGADVMLGCVMSDHKKTFFVVTRGMEHLGLNCLVHFQVSAGWS